MFHRTDCNYSYHKNANYSFNILCNHTHMETIGQRILRLRESAGLSQEDVGKACGRSRVAVTKWESGQTANLKLSNLTALCKLFSVSYDYLIEGEENGVESEKIDNKPAKFLSKKDKKIKNITETLPFLDEKELDVTKSVTTAFKNKAASKRAQNHED